MSEKKYTPGPWIFVHEPETNGSRPFAVKGDEYYLADIYSDVCDGESNARLISCAPELLEALEMARDIIGYPDDPFSVYMDKLIAKAKGEAE